MASTSEVGFARMLGNFGKLRENVTALGSAYNPTNAEIATASLQLTEQKALGAMEEVNDALSTHALAVDAREDLYAGLSILATRIRSAIISLRGGDAVLNDLDSIIRQLRGKRKAAPKKEDQNAKDEPVPDNSISVAQLSYDHRYANFSRLVDFVSHLPFYTPNETELSLAGLQQTLAALKAANAAVVAAFAALVSMRQQRDIVFFHAETGLVTSGNEAKAYLKSAFGAGSPQYKAVSSLNFRVHRD